MSVHLSMAYLMLRCTDIGYAKLQLVHLGSAPRGVIPYYKNDVLVSAAGLVWMLGVHIRLISHRVTPSGQFGVLYKMYFFVESRSLQELCNGDFTGDYNEIPFRS